MVNLEATCSIVVNRIIQLESSIRLLLEEPSASTVHRMRVDSRQLETALYLTKSASCRKDYDYFKYVCKYLIRCSSQVRDMDVMLADGVDVEERIKAKLLRERKRASRKLQARISQLLNGREFEKYQVHIKRDWETPTIDQFRFRLLRLYGRFLIARPSEIKSRSQLHRWRIAVKKLRYALDFMIACNHDHWIEFTKAMLVELQDETGHNLDERNILKGLKQYGFNRKRRSERDRHLPGEETKYHAFQMCRVQLGFTKIFLRTLDDLDS